MTSLVLEGLRTAAMAAEHPSSGQLTVEALDETVAAFSTPHRIWVLPILRALQQLGGRGRPKEVIAEIQNQVGDRLTPLQWAYLVKGNHVRWSRLALRKAGLVAGPTGTWELTELGRLYLNHRASDPMVLPDTIPELEGEEATVALTPLKALPATSFDGFDIPILSILAEGGRQKQDLCDEIGRQFGDRLLPGDKGFLPNGHMVWPYRASWALTYLKKNGEVRNPSRGLWEITESGRARLQAERQAWTARIAAVRRTLAV